LRIRTRLIDRTRVGTFFRAWANEQNTTRLSAHLGWRDPVPARHDARRERRPPRAAASPLDEPFKPAKLHKLLVALAYTTLSVLLLFFNKALLSSFDFPCANVITLAQLCFSNALLYGLRRGRYVAFVDDVSLVPRDCVDKRTGFPTIKARPIHWSPYDRVRVVNADP
jgi:hypothetical protein